MDDWLHTKALQHQKKRLSVTDVLLDHEGKIAGYYTLATGQVSFEDLPPEITKHLPRRVLPIAVVAWLGVDQVRQGTGIGRVLLASALRNCHEAGKTFAFMAVVIDCLNDAARAFYLKWNFEAMPGHPYRLFLSAQRLDAMMADLPS